MPIRIVNGDITKIKCDAIVNAANSSLLGGGGVDGAIHRAAGQGLYEECATLGGCGIGEAKLTGGYNLPCRYIIHTVGPVWGESGRDGELLKSCYANSLAIAIEKQCESIAFPLISAGVYGCPPKTSFRIAVETFREFLGLNDTEITLVIFDKCVSKQLKEDYSGIFTEKNVPAERKRKLSYVLTNGKNRLADVTCEAPKSAIKNSICCDVAYPGLDRKLEELDESFSDMLFRKIDELGMTDVECYKGANIDRRLFSKIRSDRLYRPGKPTALAFAVSLRLSMEETEELLRKAGYNLSNSTKFDVIVGYFIANGKYDIYEINEALYAYDQKLLG